ncbi:MAG: hypothetical protein HF962_07815, partial [Sulfurovum sp.]|nr:hypothetical protein [Sulfurovum sp.]
MRWVVFVLFTVSFAHAAPLQYLTKYLVPETAFENPVTNWNAGDDSSIQVDIGFSFPFSGTTYSRVWINSNGMLGNASNRHFVVSWNNVPHYPNAG